MLVEFDIFLCEGFSAAGSHACAEGGFQERHVPGTQRHFRQHGDLEEKDVPEEKKVVF